jgi:hypothetical protein
VSCLLKKNSKPVKELRGDLCIVASALKKMQERDEEVDPDLVTKYLTKGEDKGTVS